MSLPHPRTWSHWHWVLAAIVSVGLYAMSGAGFGGHLRSGWAAEGAGIGAAVGLFWILLVRSIFVGRERRARSVARARELHAAREERIASYERGQR